ncbi:LysR substrate binding domain-containing protein [Methylobacterium sp. UNC378MF]|nr:LysR substrate binding domain-containing protein [Methylobacterium sp. UNC378MF]
MVAGLTDIVGAHTRGLLARYPKVRLQLVVTDRPVDLIEERIDVALRVRRAPTSDASLTMRTLGSSRRILVAAPQVARSLTPDIAALGAVPG